MKYLNLLFVLALFSCGGAGSNSASKPTSAKQPQVVDIQPILKELQLGYDSKVVSYIIGQKAFQMAQRNRLMQVDEDRFLTGYFKALNGEPIDEGALRREMDQIRRTRGQGLETTQVLSENVGLIVGAQDKTNPLLANVDIGELTLGFKDAKKYENKLKFNTDSVLDLTNKAFNVDFGKKYMAAYSKLEGVKKTESGMAYEVLKEGTGAQATGTASTVTTHYRGMLLNGKEFDSSYSRDQPASFGLGQVIKGWTEGLQLMKEGSKYRFVIPYDLAYGPYGNRGIPGYATLLFDVELIKVQNPASGGN